MITPEEFRNFHDDGLADAIEQHIDTALRSAHNHTRVTINIMPGWLLREVHQVLAKYRAAGWIVGVVGDWRDGDYISMVLP